MGASMLIPLLYRMSNRNLPRPASGNTDRKPPCLLQQVCVTVAWVTYATLPSFGNATEHEIVFAAPTNHAMPLAQFKDGVLTGGIIKDVGELIASRMRMSVRFVSLPSKRVSVALEEGQIDGVCYVQPEWIDGDYHWSQPFIPNSGVIASRSGTPVVHRLEELAGVPVGTVIGYRYPDLENALGERFVREDAPTMESNIRKLMVGRIAYAVVESITLSYHMKTQTAAALRSDIEYDRFQARCAFSRKSRLPFLELDHAINSLIQDGSMREIFQRYR